MRPFVALRRASLLAAMLLVLGLAVNGPAHAYGPTHLWQVGMSFNCNNPAACEELGGFWGWVEFDAGFTGDAEVTGCQHAQRAGGTFGAQHTSVEIERWFLAPADPAQGGIPGMTDFWIAADQLTFTGRSGGPPITIDDPNVPFDTGIPAQAGHYSLSKIFGFSIPGVNGTIQVTQMH